MKQVSYLLLVVVIIASSGCETLSGRRRRQQELRLYNDIANMKADIERINQRLDGMDAGREDVYAQIADLRESLDRYNSERGAEVSAIDSKLAAQKAALAKSRKEMLDKLSHKMADIMRKQAPENAIRTESGYEHVVKPGETLSEIAKAYCVKVSVITKANKLKNPDDLRVGQKLFIPE